jgi:predicted metal-binding membrane protein
VLLVLLAVLTVGAWGLTIYQAGTMGMPMGLSLEEAGSGGSDPMEPMAPMEQMAGMESMDGMADPAQPAAASDPGAMEGMAEPSWSVGGLVLFVLVWAVMMTAMMLPAVTPMLLLYRTMADRQASDGHGLPATLGLAAGYLLVWAAVGLGVYGLLRVVSGAASQLESAQRVTWTPLVLGGVLILAGLYQFTPLKHACLRQCQSPVGFLLGHWRTGRLGAVRMGLVHGLYCVGCCWALFAVLVAAGVMSLAWMLLLTLVVFAEKVLPLGRRTAQVVGIAFLVLGVMVASGAATLPWSA